MPPPSLADLPVELLIDNLLPLLPLKDVLALATTSTEYGAICSDDTFWKRKLQKDYNFADARSARTKGYKFLYRGVHRAKLYVWGSAGEGRLGLNGLDYGGIRKGSMPYPAQLKIPGARIVELAAAGWSFHALDSEGRVHVWGKLDGSQFGGLLVDPFSLRTKRADPPIQLILPERIAKISCGRSHATFLSTLNRVWVLPSWGRPYVLTTPLLSTETAFTTPAQVECGWSFSAVLTRGGEVYVWWPLDGAFGEVSRAHDEARDADAAGRGLDGVGADADGVRCEVWEVGRDPWQVLSVAGVLPRLREGEEEGVGERIVKIAGGDHFLIGLTEGGHVLKVDMRAGEGGFSHALHRPRWEYLELFSEAERVRTHPTFDQGAPKGLPGPESFGVTHISAHFLTFFAYSTGSSSIILKGTQETTPSTLPEVAPDLQYRDIISIVLGDYHFGALTGSGQLLTWGAYSSGALGLGDPTLLPVGSAGGYVDDVERERAKRYRRVPPDVRVPSEVKFGTVDGSGGQKMFVFGAAAGGWHTGALVIDMEEGVEDPRVRGREVEEGSSGEGGSESLPGRWGGPLLPFRVGLAGAWAGRGRGRGRGGA